jgi:hypothetical protein
MKNKLLLGTLGLILISGLAFGSSKAYAAENTNPFSTIIEKLAAKFELKQEDVKQVFDDVRNEKQAANEKKYENYLSQAIKDKKITDAQKKLLIAKHQELQKSRAEKPANWQNLSAEERKTAMQKEKDDLNAWAKANNIDIKYLFGGFGNKEKGMMKGWGRGMRKNWTTPTP